VRVLVVDDDEAIRTVLARGLEAEGFSVDCCIDGDSAVWEAIDGGYAAIVLDLLLPGRSGYKVCEALRAEGIATPILVLTAKSGELDQIDLLDAGADDFLTKPVSVAVIVARLRALIRRQGSMARNDVTRGLLRYDMTTRTTEIDGAPVALSGREDQLLRHLLLADGACLTRSELLELVWGPESGTDASIVDIYLRRLRAKLAPVAVENVRGLGYRILHR